MVQSDQIKTMKSVPFFSGMAQKDIEYLFHQGNLHSFQKGNHLFLRGDKADYFYVIVKGRIKHYRDTQEGNEAILSLMGKGDTFGEAAIFSDGYHPFSAQAIEPSTVAIIPACTLKSLAHTNPRVLTQILQSFASQINKLLLENEHLSEMSAPQRVGCMFLQLSNDPLKKKQTIHLPYEKSTVASRLGMKPETFSRALAKLKKLGIKVNGNMIDVDDISKLANFVCGDCSACNHDCQFSSVQYKKDETSETKI